MSEVRRSCRQGIEDRGLHLLWNSLVSCRCAGNEDEMGPIHNDSREVDDKCGVAGAVSARKDRDALENGADYGRDVVAEFT